MNKCYRVWIVYRDDIIGIKKYIRFDKSKSERESYANVVNSFLNKYLHRFIAIDSIEIDEVGEDYENNENG